MNVTLDKTGNVSGVLTISIVEDDYQAEVKKQLSELDAAVPSRDSVQDMCLQVCLRNIMVDRLLPRW